MELIERKPDHYEMMSLVYISNFSYFKKIAQIKLNKILLMKDSLNLYFMNEIIFNAKERY